MKKSWITLVLCCSLCATIVLGACGEEIPSSRPQTQNSMEISDSSSSSITGGGDNSSEQMGNSSFECSFEPDSSSNDSSEGNEGNGDNSGKDEEGGDEGNNGENDDGNDGAQYGDLAKKVISAFGNLPDAWGFLPKSFAMENKAIVANSPLLSKGNAYEQFIQTNALPTNYIGKQMNVVYGVLNTCDVALDYVSIVHGALHTIESAYQIFLNGNPDNYALFEGTAAGFSYKLELNDKEYSLCASVSGTEVLIFGNAQSGAYGARVQLSENNVLKYEVSNSDLTIAWSVLNVATTQIRFVRDKNVVREYIYEFLTVLNVEKSTSTYLEVENSYTTVVGTKGDFVPSAEGRNCEVYDNVTGKLVGAEVSEIVGDSTVAFDTLLYNLWDIQGITSIKKIDEANGVNADTVYINNSTEALHTKLVGLLGGLSAASRRCDIEFKEVCAYVYDANAEKYKEVTFEVPMLFVQEKYASSLEEDFAEKNKVEGETVAIALQTSSGGRAAVNSGYHILVAQYNQIKDSVTRQDILNYCAR